MPRLTNHLAGALLVFLAGSAMGADGPAADPVPASPTEQHPTAPALQAPADSTHAADAVQVPESLLQPVVARRKVQSGRATWYAHRFHGRRTSSGERYDRHALTAAHPTLPIPSYARVRNPANGREVVVRINDRGPFHSGHAIDLSHAAAEALGVVHGPSTVEIEHLGDSPHHGGAATQAPVARAAAKPRLAAAARRTRAGVASAGARRTVRALSAPSHKSRRHRLTDAPRSRT